MQKRTNPLALTNDDTAAKPIRREAKIESPRASQAIGHLTADEPSAGTPNVPRAPERTVSQIKKASDFAPMVKSVAPESEYTPVESSAALPVIDDSELYEEAYSAVSDSVSAAYVAELAAQTDDTPIPAPDGCIEDEEIFPTLQDFELSARFRLRGRVSRRLALTKLSRDVCRLAQLLHPGEPLSSIVESALLTRIFLENPEAFDAMAALIEEKGGRIQC